MRYLILILLTVTAYSCRQTEEADLLIYHAKIYTVDPGFSKAESIAIKDGKIIAIGSTKELTGKYFSKDKIDALGKYIFPGLIDAHAHFYHYGLGLETADLTETKSWNDILNLLKTFAASHPYGWLTGHGWDQNKWAVKEFPDNSLLDSLFPNRPVVLTRIDGHALVVNQKALSMADIIPGMQVPGGSIESRDGKLTGVLIDNAQELVYSKIPTPDAATVKTALLKGQQNCFKVGLTTVNDCGLHYSQALLMDSLQKRGELKMRLYVMLSDLKENYDFLFAKGKIKTDRMDVRSFKVYADGALGSRGACLLSPYNDKTGWFGFLLNSAKHFDSVANIISQHGFQMCTHAIGDSGNRVILNIYSKYLNGKNDLRWRIEHAQVINENDFSLFGRNNIVPSVQPTHATSDMNWALTRLGPSRIKGAYAYKRLLDQNGWIPLGTDFPVEDISPFKTFYAAVFRKNDKGEPAKGFQTGNALSREEALKGMTIWAAKACFEEKEKGSLEVGKLADFVLVDTDLMVASPGEILSSKVLMTVIGGEKVYEIKSLK